MRIHRSKVTLCLFSLTRLTSLPWTICFRPLYQHLLLFHRTLGSSRPCSIHVIPGYWVWDYARREHVWFQHFLALLSVSCGTNPVQILAVNLNEQSAFLVKGREQWHEGEMKNEKGMKHFAVDLWCEPLVTVSSPCTWLMRKIEQLFVMNSIYDVLLYRKRAVEFDYWITSDGYSL